MKIFVSSPQAQSGKTFISAGLVAIMQALGYKSAYHKPIQSGAEENYGFLVSPDVGFVKNIDPYVECVCSYIFKTLAAPAIASELENIKVDSKVILKDYKKISSQSDCTVVEGLDGLLVPIAPDFLIADLIKSLELPVLFVVDPQMSNIDSVLSSINQAKSNELKIAGVVLNKFPYNTTNDKIKSMPRLIEEYSDTKIVGIVKQLTQKEKTNPTEIISILLNSLDVEKIFDVPLPKLNI